MKLNQATWMTLIFTALVILFLADSFELSKVAGRIPQVALVTTLVLLFMQLLMETNPGLRRRVQNVPSSKADHVAGVHRRGSETTMALAVLRIGALAPLDMAVRPVSRCGCILLHLFALACGRKLEIQ